MSLKNAIRKTIKTLEEIDLNSKYRQLLEVEDNPKAKEFIQQAIVFLESQNAPKPAAYNHGINDGEAAGRTVHHLHWHVLPRYEGDVADPRGGIRHMFAGKGNYAS